MMLFYIFWTFFALTVISVRNEARLKRLLSLAYHVCLRSEWCYFICDFLHKFLQCFDSFVEYLLISLSHYFFSNLLLKRFIFWGACPSRRREGIKFSSDDDICYEISRLSHSIYKSYIESWYKQVVSLDDNNFKKHFCKNLEESVYNFYKLCQCRVKSHQMIDRVGKVLSVFLIEQQRSDKKSDTWSTQGETRLLVDLVNEVFTQVLPEDVNSLVTSCDCCQPTTRGPSCLEQSTNPVRLFLFNLITYSLLLPLIDKCTHPRFVLYHFLHLLSFLGGISLEEFVSRYGSQDFDYLDASNGFFASPDRHAQDALKTGDDMAYEAVEDSKDMLIFSNIKIVSTKISSTDSIVNVSKINPFVDYVIHYNVLSVEHTGEAYSTVMLNNHIFLQLEYQMKRRFSEFLAFQQRLEKQSLFRKYLLHIKRKPSSIYYHPFSLVNFIKPTKFDQNSYLIRQRRECLETFLNDLANYKVINESREFCEFLGYSYKSVQKVRQLLADSSRQQDTSTRNSSKFRTFEVNIMKGFLKLFKPDKPKFGQISTQVENCFVVDSKSKMYSIMPIKFIHNLNNEMMLQQKLNEWSLSLTTGHRENRSKSYQCNMNLKSDYDPVSQQLSTLLYLLIFGKFYLLSQFFINKISCFMRVLWSRLKARFIFNEFFRSYTHSLHKYILEDSVGYESPVVTYEMFYELFSEDDLASILDLYLQINKEKMASQWIAQSQSEVGSRFNRACCDLTFGIIGFGSRRIVSIFSDHRSNKRLLYRILETIRQEIKVES